MPKQAAPSPWENRIVRYGDEDPTQLLANPLNFRVHPRSQQEALSGAIGEVGWIAPVIVNETTQHVIDGHARIEIAISRGEATVPVAYVQLSEEHERLALATFDPIGALAVMDGKQLDSLLADVVAPNSAIERMLSDLAAGSPTLDGRHEELDLSPDEKRDVFENGLQRQIYLLFTAEEYARVMRQFEAIMRKRPELETNVDVVKFLLDQATIDDGDLG